MKKRFRRVAFVLVGLVAATVSTGVAGIQVPYLLSYQGYLTDAAGAAVDAPAVPMTFRLYPAASGPEPPYWTELQTVTVSAGVYSVVLGSVEPILSATPFMPGTMWLEVEVNGEVLTPRQRLLTAPYALLSHGAGYAEDAGSLGGQTPGYYDQSAHLLDTANPHQVTPHQIGAPTTADLDGGIAVALVTHSGDPSAHHAKTTRFAELTDQASDAQIPPGVARDAELTWGNLTGVPAGFADGVDNGLASEDDPQVGALSTGAVPRWNGTALVNGAVYETAGKVGIGIGTAAPAEKLEVAGNLQLSPGGDRSIILPDGTRSLFLGGGTTPPWSLWLTSKSYLAFKTNGSERMRVNNAGNVGVGTTSPTARVTAQVPSAAVGSPVAVAGKNVETGSRGELGGFGFDNQGPYGIGVYGAPGARGWAGRFDGDVKVAGTGKGIEFPDGSKQTTAYTGVGFPRPNYDSGWVKAPTVVGGFKDLTHNVGGQVDNYVVELTFKNNGGVYNRGIGGDHNDSVGGNRGAYWESLTTSTVRVVFVDSYPWLNGTEYFRIRIWVYP